MQCEPNTFKQKLYDEFEQNSYKVLGVPTDRIREVLSEHGNLILRGASVAKASHQITPGQDVAIAVFKNDNSFSISLSFKQKTEA